ncbi:MAG: tryptophan-rich sensory protein [Winogradskyella sp.]|uniref:TspO/MBR family protein n=1 Tax=Winogradskyella sp. TaxID=1883156 RepID=UPI000F40E439|nr:TspO/MBR family protein [Winogradskyella sp.]RNC86491.1 MAG: tryptophan-rich sensory protein [Winogradskyella sp.]
MKKLYYFLIFLIINFGGLALGIWLMNGETTGQWYINLNKAPWEPPGLVFGYAWTLIMICFSWYLAELFYDRGSKFLWSLYTFQVILNVSWNWIFFNQHFTKFGLIVIIMLLLVIIYYFITFRNDRLKHAKYLLLPYIIWLCIATSLNGYIVFNN